VSGVAGNPVWSPDGSVIVYTGPVVGITGALLMIRSDGTAMEAPAIRVRVGTEHYRFVPGRQELVYVPTVSQAASEKFWLLDLATKKSRQLATFDSRLTRTFDITPRRQADRVRPSEPFTPSILRRGRVDTSESQDAVLFTAGGCC
jgi:hypothetical protein